MNVCKLCNRALHCELPLCLTCQLKLYRQQDEQMVAMKKVTDRMNADALNYDLMLLRGEQSPA